MIRVRMFPGIEEIFPDGQLVEGVWWSVPIGLEELPYRVDFGNFQVWVCPEGFKVQFLC